jgi:hypothetical protein
VAAPAAIEQGATDAIQGIDAFLLSLSGGPVPEDLRTTLADAANRLLAALAVASPLPAAGPAFAPPLPPANVLPPIAALARALPEAHHPASPLRSPNGATKTERELLVVCTPEIARRSLLGQLDGLPARGPAEAIRPAITNARGCWLSQARGQQNGGHCQMAPLFARMRTRAANGAGAVAQRRMPQLLHRLAIRAWGTHDQQRQMIEGRSEVSHLCHEPNCFNPVHLVLEVHHENMARRECARLGVCACGLQPQCIL